MEIASTLRISLSFKYNSYKFLQYSIPVKSLIFAFCAFKLEIAFASATVSFPSPLLSASSKIALYRFVSGIPVSSFAIITSFVSSACAMFAFEQIILTDNAVANIPVSSFFFFMFFPPFGKFNSFPNRS